MDVPRLRPPDAPQPQPKAERWEIGIDKAHVAAYVGVALIAGFAMGFLAARYMNAASSLGQAGQQQRRGSIQNGDQAQAGPSAAVVGTDFHTVTKVMKSDTIQVDTVGTVRMLGIETPAAGDKEDKSGSTARDEAVKFTSDSLLSKQVRLEFDSATAPSGNKDESGNLLAYVYTQDGALFNEELVKRGDAFVRIDRPFRLMDEFRSLERDAMEKGAGVWAPSGTGGALAQGDSAGHGKDTGKDSSKDRPGSLAKGRDIPPFPGADLDSKSPSSASDTIVFVSAEDHMYHKDGCEYLGKKKRPMLLSEAKAEGYVACGRCFASTVLKAQ